MAFPEYKETADALLAFIYLNGGKDHFVKARSTYDPLADHFGLSAEERSRPRRDGGAGTQWENHVQWTRQRLINNNLLKSKGHGYWQLTPAGIARATLLASGFSSMKQGT